jgi:hypothetical protein
VSTDEAIQEVAPEVAAESAEQGGTARAVVSGLGPVTSVSYNLGPSGANNSKRRLTRLQLSTDQPAVVLLQPRQADNQDFNFPDQFAAQVITTARDSIVCVIRRLDQNMGWGQNLRLDLLVVDQIHNP